MLVQVLKSKALKALAWLVFIILIVTLLLALSATQGMPKAVPICGSLALILFVIKK